MKVAFFGPWIGEFGWELMTWQGWCRAESSKYDKSYVCSYADVGPLYQDFATFLPHQETKRYLNWTKNLDQIELPHTGDMVTDWIKPFKCLRPHFQLFVPFGVRQPCGGAPLIALHARAGGVAEKNSPPEWWRELVEALVQDLYEYYDQLHRGTSWSKGQPDIAFVGTQRDIGMSGWDDFVVDHRHMGLYDLMNLLANVQVVVGQSSGVMHLAALCRVPLVVWGDRRTYNNETLEKRYQNTWNPFGVPVKFIFTGRPWQPEIMEVRNAVRETLARARAVAGEGEDQREVLHHGQLR